MNSIVFNEDCVAGMKKFPDKYFDLAVADPPYFSGPERRAYYGASKSTTGISRHYYPVTERLPKEAAFLVATRDGAVGEAFLEKENIYWREDIYRLETADQITDAVTHWMPLPEPPKKEIKNETT